MWATEEAGDLIPGWRIQGKRVVSKAKSRRHHWWPICVSGNWADQEGCVNCLLPDGTVRRAPPKNFGVIGGGHEVKASHKSGEATVWDYNFESEFQRADNNFPPLITWLEGLDRKRHLSTPKRKGGLANWLRLLNGVEQAEVLPLRERFLAQAAPDNEIGRLVEGLVSLAVRCPMNREAAVSLAEHYRGPLPERERNALIGLNMQRSHQEAVRAIGTRGKFAVLYSPDREFYHTLLSPVGNLMNPKILAPITPQITVLFARPLRYATEPRLSTLVVSSNEADRLNLAVQVYARNAIFYRTDRPNIDSAYREGKHLQFASPDNPVDVLIHSIPGIPPRDTSLDFLITRTADD